MEGTAFGRYRLIELIGRGGMGEVWRAHDTTIDRVVALKMLLPHYAADPDFEQRFRREARAAARVDDPHIVPIFDVGQVDDRLYVTMRLVDGVDLQTLLQQGPLEPARAVHIIEQIASALNTAHQAGLVHRDVKPSNILLAHNDFAYLIDFGIARSTGDSALTSANSTVGTWAYMAPERFRTGESAPTSDIYALACVFYQCLTGHPPFPGAALEHVAMSHLMSPPPKPSDDLDTLPTAIDDVIAVGLAKQPTDRYPNALAMATAARRALNDPAPTQPWTASPSPPKSRRGLVLVAIAATVLLVAAGVVAAVALTGRDHKPAPAASGTGPFTGLYRADFGRATQLDGVSNPGSQPATAAYGIRSVCRPTGCVATAARQSGDKSFAPIMVFDQIGPSWVAVAVAPSPCPNGNVDGWQVITLAPQPEGTLTGANIRTTSNRCQEKRPVTFTRVGDVATDSTVAADPADLAPRVASPAEGLRGRYTVTRTFSGKAPQALGESEVTTYCLRTGDRCMSYVPLTSGDLPMEFSTGTWAWRDDSDGQCPGGAPSHLKALAQYALPAPAPDPIPALSGHGTWVQTGSCRVDTSFDETFTRTGD